MVLIKRWESKELLVGTDFDGDGELDVTILDDYLGEVSIWLKKEDVEKLIEHLQNVA